MNTLIHHPARHVAGTIAVSDSPLPQTAGTFHPPPPASPPPPAPIHRLWCRRKSQRAVHHFQFLLQTVWTIDLDRLWRYCDVSGLKRLYGGRAYRGADKSLARPTSRCILFDGKTISFDASLVIHINSTNIPPIMIINRIYEHQNLLSM